MSWIKYKVEVHQVYSNGQWVDIEPLETRLSDPMGVYDTMEECYRGNIPQYQWVDKPELEPICDDCYDPIYRWHQMDDSNYMCEQAIPQYRYVDTTGTMCVACDKYNRAIQQVSYDSGATWANVDPPVYTATTLVEADCPDCCQHRWHQADASNYACDNANKYYKEVYQVSYDSGVTWSDVYPEQSRRTDTLIEADSYDCGYRTRTITTAEYCNMFDKCVDEKNQVSRDYGNTWETTATTTTVVQADSPDCIPYADEYFSIEVLEDGEFGLVNSSGDYYYSKNSGQTWTKLYSSTPDYVSGQTGDLIMFKGTRSSIQYQGVGNFRATGNFNVRGNLDSLTKGDNFRNNTSSTNYHYYGLFSGNTHLISAEKLAFNNKTDLREQCYHSLFRGCTNLVKAPLILPTNKLGTRCYSFMFAGCTSLQTTPKLPSNYSAGECYRQMFSGCTSLTDAPVINFSGSSSACCYQMFFNCTSLTGVQETLSAKTAADHAYFSMFYNCSGLTRAPEILASGASDYCFSWMFYHCSNLSYIKCLVETPYTSNGFLHSWVDGVAATGTFIKSPNRSWTTGTGGIPSGWTVEDAT